ncbi:hypothetical protein ACHAWO_003659 [Cyclotella atomus]|uniref:Uncharacterized protein n=1 Tax=Cyclotella atomus TaxID=382360 RepID=A0ABD3NAE2_9STRA
MQHEDAKRIQSALPDRTFVKDSSLKLNHQLNWLLLVSGDQTGALQITPSRAVTTILVPPVLRTVSPITVLPSSDVSMLSTSRRKLTLEPLFCPDLLVCSTAFTNASTTLPKPPLG